MNNTNEPQRNNNTEQQQSPSTRKEERDIFHKPAGDVGEVTANYNAIENEEINDLKNELIHIENAETKFEKEQIDRANEESKRRARNRKEQMKGRLARQNIRLDTQHEQLFKDISFQDQDLYLYERILCPGDTLLQFLAPMDSFDAEPPHVPSHKLASTGTNGRVNLKRLRMWMPDTVVFCGADGPFWLFSHRDGLLYRTKDFPSDLVISRIGSRKYPEDLIAVYKQTQFTPSNKQIVITAHEPQKYEANGNHTKIINTNEMETLIASAKEDKGNSLSILQRYLKPKGSQANVFRCCIRRGQQPQGWAITNIARFEEEFKTKPGEIITPEQLTERFCTNAKDRHLTRIFPMQQLALEPLVALTSRTAGHLERQIRRAFDTFVCDFIKDESNEYWLTQIKGYKLTDAYLHRPFKLNRRQQRRFLHTKSLYTYNASSMEESSTDASNAMNKSRDRGNSIISTQSGGDNGLGGSSKMGSSSSISSKKLDTSNILRCVKCRFCDLDFESSQLPYKMTLKMIKDTQRRLQLRISRPRFVALFGDKKVKKNANRRSSSDRTNLYRAYDVCKECYKLYQSDVKLQVLQSKFSAALGIPVLKESNVGDVMEQIYAARDMMRVSERKNMKYRADSPRKKKHGGRNISPIKSKRNTLTRASFSKARLLEEQYRNSYSRVYQKVIEHDPLQAALEASQSQRPTPPELTMFRLLIVFNEIHDFPINFATRLRDRQQMSRETLTSNGSAEEEFYLVYETLGQKVAIPIDCNEFLNAHDQKVREREERREGKYSNNNNNNDGGGGGGKYESTSNNDDDDDDNEEIKPIPLKLHRARMHYFFAAQHSPGNVNLDSSRHGLDVFIEDIDDICISLCKGIRPASKSSLNNSSLGGGSGGGGGKSDELEAFPHILKEYGVAKLSIRQFKSKFVNKHDCFASFGLGAGGMCSVRATIGIDHTREQLDSRLLDAEHTIKFENGVYIPPPSFSSPDPLPDEWLEILGKVQHLHYELTSKHELEHQQEMIKKQQENKIDKLWCLQMELHAVNYLCDVLDNGNFDIDSKYYATYTLLNKKYQTEDTKPTFDPDELTKPLLAFESTRKYWAKGSVHAMKHYFNTLAKPMEINIYKRRTNPFLSILDRLNHAFDEIDFELHGSVVLKELGYGIIFNPRTIEALLTTDQASARRQYIDESALKNKLKSISVLNQGRSSGTGRFKNLKAAGSGNKSPSPRKRGGPSSSPNKKNRNSRSNSNVTDDISEKYNEMNEEEDDDTEILYRWPRNEFCDLDTYVEGTIVIGELMLRKFQEEENKIGNSVLHEAISRDEWVQSMCQTVQLRYIYEAAIHYRGGIKNVTGVQKLKAARLTTSFSSLLPTSDSAMNNNNHNNKATNNNNNNNNNNNGGDDNAVPPNVKFETFSHELHHHCGKEYKLPSLAYESCLWALTEGAAKCDLICPLNPIARKQLLQDYLTGFQSLPDYKPVTWKKFLRACLSTVLRKTLDKLYDTGDQNINSLEQQSSFVETNKQEDILMGTALVDLSDLGMKNQMDSTYDIEMIEESWEHTYPPYLSLSAFVLKIDPNQMRRGGGGGGKKLDDGEGEEDDLEDSMFAF